MLNKHRLLRKAIDSPNNLAFNEFVALIEAFGFQLRRSRGSHRMFSRVDVTELINVQDMRGKAKAYQVRDFLALVEEYKLELED